MSISPPTIPTAPSPALAGQQLCTCCWRWHPVADFARRRKGEDARSHRCDGCKRDQERARYRDKQRKRIGRLMNQLARENDGSRVEMLVAATMAQFKSPDDFMRQWLEHLRAAMDGKPGNRRVLVAFVAIFRMVATVAERQQAGEA